MPPDENDPAGQGSGGAVAFAHRWPEGQLEHVADAGLLEYWGGTQALQEAIVDFPKEGFAEPRGHANLSSSRQVLEDGQ